MQIDTAIATTVAFIQDLIARFLHRDEMCVWKSATILQVSTLSRGAFLPSGQELRPASHKGSFALRHVGSDN